MLKVCISLVEDKTTLNYFMNKFNIENNHFDNIVKAFYQESKFLPKQKRTKDIIVEVCISKGWQQL
jgi:hypothetical protein